MFAFFIPLGLLGILQHFTGRVLIPTDSPNGYLAVMSWEFYGAVRGFSLFNSPSYFGHFIALTAGIAMALYLSREHSAFKSGAILLLAFVSGYSTLTRATQMEIACVVFTVWLLYRSGPRYRKFMRVLPIVYALAGVCVAFIIPVFLAGASSDLLANDSLVERYAEWVNYGGLWVGNGLTTFLLGTGIAQNDRFGTSAGVLVDNSFLGVGLHIGAIGLLLWLVATWRVWRYLLDGTQRRLTPVRAAATAAWSVWLFTSVFNSTLFYILPFVIFLLTNGSYARRVPVLRPSRALLPAPPRSLGTLGQQT